MMAFGAILLVALEIFLLHQAWHHAHWSVAGLLLMTFCQQFLKAVVSTMVDYKHGKGAFAK
jgi:hypothetical protein